MSGYYNGRPAWKMREDEALAIAYAGTSRTATEPRQAYLEDTPQRPAMPLVGYWMAGGKRTLQKIIAWGLPNMGMACEMVNDYAKRFPDYTFACGMVTATYNHIGWETYTYRYDPDTRRCYNLLGPADQ